MATKKHDQEFLGERLINLRRKKGLSQLALATHAGVDRKTINRIENGWFSPNLTTLNAITIVLGTTPSAFLKGVAL